MKCSINQNSVNQSTNEYNGLTNQPNLTLPKTVSYPLLVNQGCLQNSRRHCMCHSQLLNSDECKRSVFIMSEIAYVLTLLFVCMVCVWCVCVFVCVCICLFVCLFLVCVCLYVLINLLPFRSKGKSVTKKYKLAFVCQTGKKHE